MPKIKNVFARQSFFAVLLIGFLIVGTAPAAFGAQLNTFVNPGTPSSPFEMKYQKTIFIEYNQGGEIADQLRGTNWIIEKNAGSENPGVQDLINKINRKLTNDGSNSRISDLNVQYSAQMTGRGLSTSIDYKIILKGELSDYTIRAAQGQAPAIVDMAWRGMTVQGPIVIDDVEINQPISAIKANSPEVYAKIAGTQAENLLLESLIDAEGIKNQPLANWHFLFDPTGINVDAGTFGLSEEIKGFVVSGFTMGESSIREGRQVERVKEAQFSADKQYSVRTVQSADSANIHVIGFAAIDKLDGHEVAGVTPRAPENYATTSTGGFPVGIIYGMAGMAAVGAVAFFWFSNRQLKKEKDQGQSGIDPSRLRAYQTSAASGGYQTVRGEAQLIDDVEYQKTRSVYDEQKEDTSSSSSGSSKGAMPKGWKPKE